MLPKNLNGPGTLFTPEAASAFIARAHDRYPQLPKDFVSQACYEHADRFDEYFPLFDVAKHAVIERKVTSDWVYHNLRYDENESLESDNFYGWQYEEYLNSGSDYSIFVEMKKNKTWPFAPIIVESSFAMSELGSNSTLGSPYHLFEGTHRVSYLLKMLSLDLIKSHSLHKVFEIQA